jgi:hypothetical protein
MSEAGHFSFVEKVALCPSGLFIVFISFLKRGRKSRGVARLI